MEGVSSPPPRPLARGPISMFRRVHRGTAATEAVLGFFSETGITDMGVLAEVLTGLAAGAGGDGIVLALEVEHEGGTRIIERVGDDGPDAITGARRRAGEDVAALPEASIREMAGPSQPSQNEGIGRCRGGEMTGRGRVLGRAKARRAMGAERRTIPEEGRERKPAFLEASRHEAAAIKEEDSEQREPEQAGPDTGRDEAERE